MSDSRTKRAREPAMNATMKSIAAMLSLFGVAAGTGCDAQSPDAIHEQASAFSTTTFEYSPQCNFCSRGGCVSVDCVAGQDKSGLSVDVLRCPQGQVVTEIF